MAQERREILGPKRLGRDSVIPCTASLRWGSQGLEPEKPLELAVDPKSVHQPENRLAGGLWPRALCGRLQL